ncbi:hypothetical protein E2562_017589 [Oryza meyeriana var. granulata]|uniref:BRX domain-containing protein n=1 Tax=Oryza meyeriana var. granulata TaxID=110450 RepID=A0A6G1BLA4_9ORYZ|nr:hypothetical protein E2562_017589 [Oryza meyeriana var. granulata]
MHVCFHGGGGGSSGRVAKSISVIRDFTKLLIGRGGENHARVRRRQRRRCKNTAAPAAAAAAASASAKIAPAQLQEDEDAEEVHGGGREEEFCDKCCSALSGAGGAEEEEAATTAAGNREWVAEPEPGVLLTLVPRPDGATNRLRGIRFREELFDAWAAQCWWADNHDRIAELYSLVQPDDDEAAMLPVTPCQSEEGEEDDGAAGAESSRSPSTSTSTFSAGPSSGSGGGSSTGTLGSPILGLVTAPNTSTGAAAAAAGAQHDAFRDQQPTAAPWREWVEEYEPGVFITVRAYPGHRLQLRCVELSRQMFGEVKARVWWEENKARLHHLYSF